MSFKKSLITFFILIILISGFIFSIRFIFAQEEPEEDTIAEQGYGQACLDAKFYDIDRVPGGLCGSQDNCIAKYGYVDWEKCTADGIFFECTYSHFPREGADFELEGTEFPPNTKIYPFFCVTPESEKAGDFEPYCTTGNPDTDMIVFGAPTGGNCRLGITYEGSDDGSFMTDGQGHVIVGGRINSACQYVSYVFYGYYQIAPMGAGAADPADGDENSQQQGTLAFASYFTENSEKDCVQIYWDPYGRVFDSVSLEPMPNVKVNLLKSLDPKILVSLTRNQSNPDITNINGTFNFVVPEGIYYLDPKNIPATHTFSATPNLNALYKKIYYKNIDKKESIYRPNEEIMELVDTAREERQGFPDMEERDIPLDPGINPPFIGQIELIKNSAFQIGNPDATVYRGQATHPYPIVSLVRADNNKIIYSKEMTDESSRYGFWKVVLRNSLIPGDTPLKLILKKNPKYFGAVNDLSISKEGFLFEPILRQIKGYLKDDEGNILANKEVKIKLSMNNAVYGRYKTNAEGYLDIASSKLPLFDYYLETNNIKKTPSEFGKINRDYLSENKINLMSDQRLDSNIQNKIESIDSFSGTDQVLPKTKFLEKSNKSILAIVSLVFLLILLIIIFIFVIAYIKKKRS